MRLLVLEPYHGGSRRAWLEGLCALADVDAELRSLPARKWKWRLRAGALALAADLLQRPPRRPLDAVLVTSLLDLAVLLGLQRRQLGQARCLLYVHENQFAYPFRKREERDFQYLLAGLHAVWAADAVAFNSHFNRDTFFDGLPGLLKLVPDLPDLGPQLTALHARSRVLPVPVADGLLELEPVRDGAPIVVWNHRWEHDKNPDESFEALRALQDAGHDFRLVVLGQRFRDAPPVFERLPAMFGARLLHCGTAARAEYLDWLRRASVVLSSARHEFFGVAVLEGVAAGAWPVVPRRLAYPELYPEECLYSGREELLARLEEGLRRPPGALRPRAQALCWSRQAAAYHDFLAGGEL